MADQPYVFIAIIEGEERPKFFKSTDARLVRRHVIDNLPKPEIEVRRATFEEGWEAGLDGISILDITKKAAAAEPDLLTTQGGGGGHPTPPSVVEENANALDDGSGAAQGFDVGTDEPRLAPGEHIDPDTGEIVDDDPFGTEDR